MAQIGTMFDPNNLYLFYVIFIMFDPKFNMSNIKQILYSRIFQNRSKVAMTTPLYSKDEKDPLRK